MEIPQVFSGAGSQCVPGAFGGSTDFRPNDRSCFSK
jgi:hypothetical protein